MISYTLQVIYPAGLYWQELERKRTKIADARLLLNFCNTAEKLASTEFGMPIPFTKHSENAIQIELLTQQEIKNKKIQYFERFVFVGGSAFLLYANGVLEMVWEKTSSWIMYFLTVNIFPFSYIEMPDFQKEEHNVKNMIILLREHLKSETIHSRYNVNIPDSRLMSASSIFGQGSDILIDF